MKKTLSMLLAGAMLATALTGCGGSASSSSDSQNSAPDRHRFRHCFKIGGTGPLTGAAAIYGNACKNGAQIAVDEINAEGGDIQFELNYQDDEHDARRLSTLQHPEGLGHAAVPRLRNLQAVRGYRR